MHTLFALFFLAFQPEQEKVKVVLEGLEYPKLAWQVHLEDTVFFGYSVESGKPRYWIIRAHPMLREAAEHNLSKWKPIVSDSRPFSVEYHFELEPPLYAKRKNSLFYRLLGKASPNEEVCKDRGDQGTAKKFDYTPRASWKNGVLRITVRHWGKCPQIVY